MGERISDNWLSWRWFSKTRFENLDWVASEWFWALLLIPLFFFLKYYLFDRINKQKLPIALSKSSIKSNPITYLRFLPVLFLITSIILIIFSLARPQKTNEEVEQWSEGIDIVLNIDISESMLIEDFRPNRLEAAKEVARDFIKNRFQDRIGLVIFSGDALPTCPLTTDYDLLNTLIDEVSFDKIESRGTAIGNAIASGINFLREAVSESKVMILMSDGDNTAGNIEPITAAKLAAAYNIKTYVIAIGKSGRVPFGVDAFGRQRMVENTFDETTLREIAEIGKGNFYRVSDNNALKQVFNEIDQLERVEVKETRFKETTDFYYIYLRWAILFFILWLATKSTFITSLLTD